MTDNIKYKRVLLKLSGEALSDTGGDGYFNALTEIAAQLKDIAALGVQLGIVVGGGNIWRARQAEGMERNRADHMGMLATAINALALQDALLRLGAPSRVLSAVEMQRFCDTFSSRLANDSLNAGEIVIFACGSGSPFFTTDTAAALRACEINADALLLAKNVDAIYDKNPDKHTDAKKLVHPTYDEVIKLNLRALDLTAVTLCKESNMPIVVFPLCGPQSLMDALCGKNIGTVIDC